MLLGLPMALWGLFTHAAVGALVLYAKAAKRVAVAMDLGVGVAIACTCRLSPTSSSMPFACTA